MIRGKTRGTSISAIIVLAMLLISSFHAVSGDETSTSIASTTSCNWQLGDVAELAKYYCGEKPEARVYINVFDYGFSPSNISIETGTFVIWSSYGAYSTHSVTANTTANGSLPSFGTPLLRVSDQYGFTFSVPGHYQYYDALYPSMKGDILVHEPSFAPSVGTVLAVDMSPSTPGIVEESLASSVSSFTVNIVGTNIEALSRWKFCLHYDAGFLKATGLKGGAFWGDLAGGSIYLGVDSVVVGQAYLPSAAPGATSEGPFLLASVSFEVLRSGSGKLELIGSYLFDSEGYTIDHTRQNGLVSVAVNYSKSLCAYGYFSYELKFQGNPVPGGSLRFLNVFTNLGQGSVKIRGAAFTTSFTSTVTSWPETTINPGQTVVLTHNLSIPSETRPGKYDVEAKVTDWLYFEDYGGIYFWPIGTPVTARGLLEVRNPQNTSDQSGSLTSRLLAQAGAYTDLLLVSGAVVYVSLVLAALLLILRQKQRSSARPLQGSIVP